MRIALPYAGKSPAELLAICAEECGAACCRGPLRVLLTQDEASKLRDLAKQHQRLLIMHEDSEGAWFALDEQEGKHCPFLDTTTNKCGIYEDRPNACRNFPHMPEIKGCRLSGWEPKPTVFVGTVHGKSVPVEFLTMRDLVVNALHQAGMYGGHTVATSVRVDHNRNVIIEAFLKSKADYLLFLDDDMTFPHDVGVRLASHGKDLVAGLYFQRGHTANEVYPHWYRSVGAGKGRYGQDADELFQAIEDEVYALCRDLPYHDDALSREGQPLVQLDAAGTGCLLIHRRVLEAMPPPWFRTQGAVNGDLAFFTKARRLGFELWGDPGVICGHYRYAPISVGTFRRAVEQRQAVQSGQAEQAAENCNTPDYWDVVHGQEALGGYRRSYPGTDAVYCHLLASWEGTQKPTVIDFGCGRSYTYERLRETGDLNYVGIDFSPVAIEDNQERYPDAFWKVADLRTVKLNPETADMCLSSEVIEHLEQPEALIRLMWETVKPGGYVAIGFPVGEIEGTPPGEHVQVFDLDRMVGLLSRFSNPVMVFPGDGPRKVAVIQKPVQPAAAQQPDVEEQAA